MDSKLRLLARMISSYRPSIIIVHTIIYCAVYSFATENQGYQQQIVFRGIKILYSILWFSQHPFYNIQIAQLKTQMAAQKFESFKYFVGGIISVITIVVSVAVRFCRLKADS